MNKDELGKEGLKGSKKQKENASTYAVVVQKRGFPIIMHRQAWTPFYTVNHCEMI